jgi:hypothetical protein
MRAFALKSDIDRWLTRGGIGYLKGCYRHGILVWHPLSVPRQEIGLPLQTIFPLVTVEKPRGTAAALPAKVPRLNEKPRA